MSSNAHKNHVHINDNGIIEIHVCGDQTAASVRAMGDASRKFGDQLRAEQKPVLVLDNLLEMGAVPVEGRKQVVDLVRSSDYDRLAMLGSGALLRLGANLLLHATGRGSRVRYFEDRAEAIKWLRTT